MTPPPSAPGNDLSKSAEEKNLSGLMRAAQAGDRDAYRELLRRIQALLQSSVKNSLTRLGFGHSGASEDVIQDVLLAVHAKRDTYDPSQYFLPWLHAIARYKVIDHLRASKFQSRTDSLEDGAGEFLAAVAGPEASRVDTEQLLNQLPRKQRDLLKMVKLGGLSIQEAALKTGLTPSDVKVSIHRGIRKLQKRLKETEVEDR